ncbi:MAG: hypothetical protein LBT80_06160 [Lactobacillaceae bacterium]|jgi:hypothetical protein|nr:hypothetical protein [Lactobacillaceae bacterium]
MDMKTNEPFTLVQISEEKTHTQPGTIEASEEPVYNETQFAKFRQAIKLSKLLFN